MKRSLLSETLKAFIDRQVAKSCREGNGCDPLYANPAHQYLARLARSSETRLSTDPRCQPK